MTAPFPDSDLPDPSTWYSNVLVSAALIKSNIIDAINALRSMARGRYNETGTTTNPTNFAATTNDYNGVAAVTVTLASRRTIQVYVHATFRMVSGTAGNYSTKCAYTAGSTPGTATSFGYTAYTNCSATGVNGQSTANALASVTLDPGTYTFFPVVTRNAGGGTTDIVASHRISVYDVGAG